LCGPVFWGVRPGVRRRAAAVGATTCQQSAEKHTRDFEKHHVDSNPSRLG
jgi:hypothetical protein